MSTDRQPLLILGTGGFAAEVADIAEATGLWSVEGFVSPEKIDLKSILDYPVISLAEAVKFTGTHKVICAQGATNRKFFHRTHYRGWI